MPEADTLLLEFVGRPATEALRYEHLAVSVGSRLFTLRRDCHGRMRRIELTGPRDDVRRVREALSYLDGWRSIGRLELCDVPSVARLVFGGERVDITLRMRPNPIEVRRLLDTLLSPDRRQAARYHSDSS